MTPPRPNPCSSVRRCTEARRERFLTPEEYRRFGRALDATEADGSVFPTAVPAIRLLLLTGCRRIEIVTLKQDDVDRAADELRIHNTCHIYASRALALGEGHSMIRALLGHSSVTSTARYAHLAHRSVRDSIVRVPDSITADILRDWRGRRVLRSRQ